LVVAVVFTSLIIGLSFILPTSKGARSSSSGNGSSAAAVLIGSRGEIDGTAMGCPRLADLKTFVGTYDAAEVAGDKVGENNAILAAYSSGCMTFVIDEKGLVIDETGFLDGYYRLRMHPTEVAYWFVRGAVRPVPSQPNKP